MDRILEIDGLKKYYGRSANLTKALDGISFQVFRGEFLGIMGSSGSGKSTLLNCIASVSRPTGGKIFMRGEDVQRLKGKDLACYRGRKIGYLFQNFELIDNLTGQENILLPLSIQRVPEAQADRRLCDLASYLEISDVLDKFPAQMSGGQKQRVAAARALILEPEIILCDEPTGALDSGNAKGLMEKLKGMNEEAAATVLMATHDCSAASYCSRILFIRDGKIFHEIRRNIPEESRRGFYERILKVMAHLGGGREYVF